jgi:hypothetical protein
MPVCSGNEQATANSKLLCLEGLKYNESLVITGIQTMEPQILSSIPITAP